jgi:5-formyltetrahydrofolate cyclo-ligase
MGSVDIRSYKNELRAKYRAIRKALTPQEKREKDELIFRQIIQSRYYQQAETLICFVSTAIEIDTHRLIHHAWRQGKRVAVPKCLDDRGRMRFYYIRSLEDLEKARFSLWEPDPSRCEALRTYENSICIVPGFSFDPYGFRLGYGKGYYDRFLSKYSEIKIGICYNNCVAPALPHGRYDVPVNYLFTEKYVKKIQER